MNNCGGIKILDLPTRKKLTQNEYLVIAERGSNYKEFDKDWKSRRTNIDGTEALIHEDIFNEYFPTVMSLSETDEDTTVEYPFPLLDEEDITNSPEWNTPEQEII